MRPRHQHNQIYIMIQVSVKENIRRIIVRRRVKSIGYSLKLPGIVVTLLINEMTEENK